MCEKNNAANLVDIAAVNVDKSLPQSERFADFKRQLKDTNLYMCEGFTIRAKYSNSGDKIEDCLRGMVV